MISRVADLVAAVAAIQGDGDQTFAALTVHRDALYVGTLGRIDTDFAASIYRVSRDGARVERVATGLHGVLGIAFDRRGRLYALETTAAGVLPPLLTKLAFPSALLAGRDGEFFISNCGCRCDDHGQPSSLPSLRVARCCA